MLASLPGAEAVGDGPSGWECPDQFQIRGLAPDGLGYNKKAVAEDMEVRGADDGPVAVLRSRGPLPVGAEDVAYPQMLTRRVPQKLDFRAFRILETDIAARTAELAHQIVKLFLPRPGGRKEKPCPPAWPALKSGIDPKTGAPWGRIDGKFVPGGIPALREKSESRHTKTKQNSGGFSHRRNYITF